MEMMCSCRELKEAAKVSKATFKEVLPQEPRRVREEHWSRDQYHLPHDVAELIREDKERSIGEFTGLDDNRCENSNLTWWWKPELLKEYAVSYLFGLLLAYSQATRSVYIFCVY
jgi:hypothetical protein